MQPAKSLQGLKRSAAIQLTFFILAAAVTGLVFLNYPDPAVAFPPTIKTRLLVRAMMISGGVEEGENLIFLTEGVDVNLDLVTGGGLRHVLSTKTNSTGAAEVVLNSGYYRLSLSDWWSGYVLINQPTMVNVTMYELKIYPSSIDIFSLSKNWTISQGDVVDVSFSNPLSQPVRLQAVTIGGQTLFKGSRDVAPAAKWSDSYVVPAGLSIPWSAIRESMDLTLRISYTEVKINP